MPFRVVFGVWSYSITNDWRRSMARLIVGNRATSGIYYIPSVRTIVASDDRSSDQSWCRESCVTPIMRPGYDVPVIETCWNMEQIV